MTSSRGLQDLVRGLRTLSWVLQYLVRGLQYLVRGATGPCHGGYMTLSGGL